MKKKPNYEKPETILGNDTFIEGTLLKSKSSIQINGAYKGNIEVESSVVIGEQGKIEGNVKADFILIAGVLKGNIESNCQVHIMPTGKVMGDILCASIIIDDGAYIDGSCKMKTSNSEPQSKGKGKAE